MNIDRWTAESTQQKVNCPMKAAGRSNRALVAAGFLFAFVATGLATSAEPQRIQGMLAGGLSVEGGSRWVKVSGVTEWDRKPVGSLTVRCDRAGDFYIIIQHPRAAALNGRKIRFIYSAVTPAKFPAVFDRSAIFIGRDSGVQREHFIELLEDFEMTRGLTLLEDTDDHSVGVTISVGMYHDDAATGKIDTRAALTSLIDRCELLLR